MNEEKQIAGWLIIHTEGENHKDFELFEGKNIIGRSTPNYSPDIALTDNYLSRRHAVLIVRLNKNNFFEYYIGDNADINNGKPSMNGTFVNGSIERITNKIVEIKEDDTIQVGKIKLVLKSAKISVNVDEAIKLVEKQNYQKTVDFVHQTKLSKKIRK